MSSESEPTGPTTGSRIGYVVAIVVNVVLLYVAHHLLSWHVPFVTDRWNLVLWAVDLSLVATIAANAAYVIYDARWFKRVTQIGLNIVALLVVYLLYTFLPFDLGVGIVDFAFRIALLFAMVGVVIATIVDGVRLLLGR
jgi:hypothetical protein